MNTNILNWYPFRKDSTILYLTIEEDKEMEEYLSARCKKVTVVQFCDKKETQVETTENIEKIIGTYQKISIHEQYDYVILLGTLEYADEIVKKPNSSIEILNYAKDKTKENGSLLLSIDNRMGAKYLVGNKSKHCEHIYDSIKNKYKIGKMFSKSEIDKMIENLNFAYRKNYYPLPDYKNTNVIYTDEFLPERDDSKINYNVVYDEQSLILQDEITLLKQLIKEGNFREYTNSYLIELSNSNIENDIKYVSYNNMRKEEYSLILKMYHDTVEKQIKTEKARKHLWNIKNNNQKLKLLGFELAEEETEEDAIKSKFIEMPLLDNYIVKLIKKYKVSEAYQIIDNWYEYIKNKLNIDENGYIKDGFIDLVFENTFYDEKNDSFIFFDQEWYMENIPIDFILYRTIQNLYEHNKSLHHYLPMQEIKKRYHIEENEEYKNLEETLQREVIDEGKRKFYSEQYQYMISPEEVLKAIEDLKRFDKDNKELIAEIEEIKNKNQLEIEKIKNRSILDIIKDKLKK